MDHNTLKRNMLTALGRYWPTGGEAVAGLEFPEAALGPGAAELARVDLPDWGADLGVDGGLLVPARAVADGTGPAWERTDWWGSAHWYLHCLAEREREAARGPAHSYAARLGGLDARMWDRAWVNRMALFLRRTAAHRRGVEEDTLCGPLPEAEIRITHDVDALEKTLPIRLKQGAFHLFNACRLLLAGRPGPALGRLGAGLRFLLAGADYNRLRQIMALERGAGVRSTFHFYGGPVSGRGPVQWLLDPGYDVRAPALAPLLRELRDGGWEIGTHPSVRAFADAGLLARERERVGRAAGAKVAACRQHWLMFSFARTWAAQREAGFRRDATLGFNDRPGFRNGAALAFCPLAEDGRELEGFTAWPMVLMDAHLYDYGTQETGSVAGRMRAVLDEVRAVRGQATVIWHQRVLSRDYGWEDGFKALLAEADGAVSSDDQA